MSTFDLLPLVAYTVSVAGDQVNQSMKSLLVYYVLFLRVSNVLNYLNNY